jgi:hypothetical protein
MQFRARLAAVSGTVSKSVDNPKTFNVKLEPLELGDPDWLFERLGSYLVIDVRDIDVVKMERAMEDMLKI